MGEQKGRVASVIEHALLAVTGGDKAPPCIAGFPRRLVNLEPDRHEEANRGMLGVVHAVHTASPNIDESLRKAQRGWSFGKKQREVSWR